MRSSRYCLSVHQPWASALVAGIKHVELRTWRVDYRGPLYIHATQEWDRKGEEVLAPWMDTLRKVGLAQGGVIGSVELANIILYMTPDLFARHEKYHRCPASWWTAGIFGWVFGNPERVKFLPCAGQQRLWRL